MKTDVIQNQYDGPRAPAKQFLVGQVSLDFINSNDAAEIDAGIRECIRGMRVSILAMGLGLAKFKTKGLYADLRYHSMNDYLEVLCDEMKVERSTVHNWLYIGEAYTKYRNDLEKIKFSDEDGPTKLPYVDRALEVHDRQEVFRNVKKMTLQKFKEYARKEETTAPPSRIRVVGNQVFIGKKLAVTLADELDPETRDYLEKINVQAGKALEAGEVLYTTRLYDMDELRKFGRGAERLKKSMRIGTK